MYNIYNYMEEKVCIVLMCNNVENYKQHTYKNNT